MTVGALIFQALFPRKCRLASCTVNYPGRFTLPCTDFLRVFEKRRAPGSGISIAKPWLRKVLTTVAAGNCAFGKAARGLCVCKVPLQSRVRTLGTSLKLDTPVLPLADPRPAPPRPPTALCLFASTDVTTVGRAY